MQLDRPNYLEKILALRSESKDVFKHFADSVLDPHNTPEFKQYKEHDMVYSEMTKFAEDFRNLFLSGHANVKNVTWFGAKKGGLLNSEVFEIKCHHEGLREMIIEVLWENGVRSHYMFVRDAIRFEVPKKQAVALNGFINSMDLGFLR